MNRPPKVFELPGDNHKLSEDDVREIRRLLAEKVTGREIAKKFDVSEMTISKIKKNRIYRYVK